MYINISGVSDPGRGLAYAVSRVAHGAHDGLAQGEAIVRPGPRSPHSVQN